MTTKRSRDFHKFTGTIYGLAAGDALGFPVEFLSRGEIMEKYGPSGVYRLENKSNLPLGTYSDDTQMSLAVAQGILRSKTNSVDEIMTNISQEFVRWKNSPEYRVGAPGNTCTRGVENIENGVNYKESGIKGSK